MQREFHSHNPHNPNDPHDPHNLHNPAIDAQIAGVRRATTVEEAVAYSQQVFLIFIIELIAHCQIELIAPVHVVIRAQMS
jgi:hypothetical protein